jgi:hypothetical protein
LGGEVEEGIVSDVIWRLIGVEHPTSVLALEGEPVGAVAKALDAAAELFTRQEASTSTAALQTKSVASPSMPEASAAIVARSLSGARAFSRDHENEIPHPTSAWRIRRQPGLSSCSRICRAPHHRRHRGNGLSLTRACNPIFERRAADVWNQTVD